MVNYGNVPGVQNAYNTGMQNVQAMPQPQASKPATDYSNWINPQPQPQQIPPAEQRGITVSYMVQSRDEYKTIRPIAGQTIAIFNFPDHELCLKAMDPFGIDFGIRTFELKETTPNIPVQQTANQNGQLPPPPPAEPQVTKAEFEELKESLNSLIKELKG